MFANRPTMRDFVHMEDGVPILNEDEIIEFTKHKVGLSFSADVACTTGTLYVTNRRILWASETCSYDFDVPYIALHAITHDTSSFPQPCVYCQLDEEESERDEVYFVPEAPEELQEIFNAFSNAAMQNPDPEEDDGGNDDFIYNLDEVELGAQQAAALAQFDSVFHVPEQYVNEEDDANNMQYEDAEEDDNEEDESNGHRNT